MLQDFRYNKFRKTEQGYKERIYQSVFIIHPPALQYSIRTTTERVKSGSDTSARRDARTHSSRQGS